MWNLEFELLLLSVFYFTFGVTLIAVRSVVLINDNNYDMMMNMKRMMIR